ncbi:MAG: ACT domain-containing protein [Elusimicrobia bacterium]|nr:ACT domain-containing protein [Elusimicrobiota bacterium]
MPVKIVKQYSVFLPNVPGSLSKFIQLFADDGVNIIGIASEIRDDTGIVRIAVDTDSKISYIVTKAGFTTIETPMISVELADKPGEFFKLTKILAEHSINITTVYGTSIGAEKTGRILLNVSDPVKTLDILNKELANNGTVSAEQSGV